MHARARVDNTRTCTYAPPLVGVTFSKDPRNLTNIHSYKASGLAQSKVLNVVSSTKTTTKGSKTTIALLHSTKTVNKPATGTKTLKLSRNSKEGAKTISALVANSHFRPDLKAAALRKYSALSRAATKSAVTSVKTGRKTRATLVKA